MASLADLKRIKLEGVGRTPDKKFDLRVIPNLVPDNQWGETFHFNDRRYYRPPNGGVYPSVTTLLGAFEDDSQIIAWRNRVGKAEADRICKRSTDRGTAIHEALEHYIQGIPYDVQAGVGEFTFMYEQIRLSLMELNSWSYVEHALYSEKMKVAGRCDLMGVFRNRKAIIDYKNKNYVFGRSDMRDYFIQGCLYALMHEERYGEKIDDVVIISSEEDKKRTTAHVFVQSVDSLRDETLDKVFRFHRQHADWYDIPPLFLL
ncbi:putative exonuclease [Acinetobacter phage SH-Ab 15599]|nr:putative exonuclease [Acinetobacter phage SH-Ab 15599]